MPIVFQDSILYSAEELSCRTNIPLETIHQSLKNSEFVDIKLQGEVYYIAEKSLAALFNHCFAGLGVSPSYYEIPPELHNTNLPWANTLVKMYQESFVFGTSLSPSQGKFLQMLVSNVQPQTIVEIGSFAGISSIWMASGFAEENADGKLYAIDTFYDIMPCFPYRSGYVKTPLSFAKNAIASASLSERIQFIQMNSYDAGKQFETLINRSIDLLYIDGDHSARGCMNDFALFAPYVSQGGLIILHDIYPDICGYDGPRYVLDHVINRSPQFHAIELTTTPRNYGIAIIQKGTRSMMVWITRGHWKLGWIRLKARLQKTPFWNTFQMTRIKRKINKGA